MTLPSYPALAALEVKKTAAGLFTDAQRAQLFADMRAAAKARDAKPKPAVPPKPAMGVDPHSGRPPSGHGSAAFSAGE